jgi:glutathione synthase/RimK-type ligase-like ATP-grasp enzyme
MGIPESDYSPLNGDTLIMMSSTKKILAEYRMFIVDGKIVSGSVYKQGTMGISHLNKLNAVLSPDESVISITQRMIDKWQPAEAFVIDIAKTDDGLKVIEINNFNSSGFYSCDVYKIINSIEEYID